jgi:hypothetical protein
MTKKTILLLKKTILLLKKTIHRDKKDYTIVYSHN